MIWSRIAKVCTVLPTWVAEFAAPAPDRKRKSRVLGLEEIRRLIREMPIAENEDGAGFADEPILVSDQRVLDDPANLSGL